MFKSWKLAGLEADIELGVRAHRFHSNEMYRRSEVKKKIRDLADQLLVDCPKGRRDEFYYAFLSMAVTQAHGFCCEVYLKNSYSGAAAEPDPAQRGAGLPASEGNFARIGD